MLKEQISEEQSELEEQNELEEEQSEERLDLVLAQLFLPVAALGAGLAVGACILWKARKKARHTAGGASQPCKIVILGAGFGGIQVAEDLARLLPARSGCEITLLDQNNFLLFTPMLTEVAGGAIDALHAVSSVRCLSPRICFKQGRIDAIDARSKSVTVTLGAGESGIPETTETLAADYLVIALGAVTNYHGLPGLKEHSLAVSSVADAAAIRGRALELLGRADAEPDAAKRRALLTLVVGGGGFSGVETMAAVNDLMRDEAARFPRLKADDITAILLEPGKRLLPELSESLGRYTRKKLEERGVQVRLGTGVNGAGNGYVEIKDGPRILTHFLIWAGGILPSPVLAKTEFPKGERGGLVADTCCTVLGYPGVWALGDCAEIPQPGGMPYSPTAQNATREGSLVARNILAALTGAAPKPFRYRPIGELAVIGKRVGAAHVFGLNFSGLLAWAMWRGVYLLKMPGMGNRIRIALDWTLDTFLGRELAELPFRS